jgi:hypothetical protein
MFIVHAIEMKPGQRVHFHADSADVGTVESVDTRGNVTVKWDHPEAISRHPAADVHKLES